MILTSDKKSAESQFADIGKLNAYFYTLERLIFLFNLYIRYYLLEIFFFNIAFILIDTLGISYLTIEEVPVFSRLVVDVEISMLRLK